MTNKGSTNNPTLKSVSASERNKILEGRRRDVYLERAAKITVLPNVEEMARNLCETTRNHEVLVPFKDAIQRNEISSLSSMSLAMLLTLNNLPKR